LGAIADKKIHLLLTLQKVERDHEKPVKPTPRGWAGKKIGK
jgi:hypothetical protein